MLRLRARFARSTKKLFFMDGPAGSGKTFVYNTLMHRLRGTGANVIPVALTGIAATLLNGGRTAHSVFKLPVPLNETSVSSIKPGDVNALRLLDSDLIIWDEISMAPGKALIVVDRLLRDITGKREPFGGKVILLGGDFRQCLPVVPKGGEVAIINDTVKRTHLWMHFETLKLHENMRADASEREFSEWLMMLGESKLPASELFGPSSVEIPPECICKTDLVEEIFGSALSSPSCRTFASLAILTPCNAECYEMNNMVVDLIDGDPVEFKSVDSIDCDTYEERIIYPMEFINSQTPSGMPPHVLRLKVGAIIMLLKNLDTSQGLCNGTRMIIVRLHENFIEAAHIAGEREGKVVFIPRINCTSTRADVSMPFNIKRRQFPVRLAFVMTINKAQGQTLEKVGLYLPEPVFGHGQIYVAFSRVRRFSDIAVHVVNGTRQGNDGPGIFTQNVVYRNIL